MEGFSDQFGFGPNMKSKHGKYEKSTAVAKIAEGRNDKNRPWYKINFPNFERDMCKGKLARFYVSGVTNFQRWHDKLGHPGRKMLRKCNNWVNYSEKSA